MFLFDSRFGWWCVVVFDPLLTHMGTPRNPVSIEHFATHDTRQRRTSLTILADALNHERPKLTLSPVNKP